MSKPLSPEQLAFLRYTAGVTVEPKPPMTSRGLVSRGCLAYKWGQDASMGYNLTPKGRRLLNEADAADRKARPTFEDLIR